jgi:hypothetical protein
MVFSDEISDCGSYRRRSVGSGTLSMDYYYDAASGALAAVLTRNPPAPTVCAAGPQAGFAEPICSLPVDNPSCAAAGTDGGAPDGPTSGDAL